MTDDLAVVVLAGGASTRFGTDKLEAPLGPSTVLDHLLLALPAAADVLLVGPVRPTARGVRAVREDPPGGGPAAGLVAGLRAVGPASTIVVLPGDAPGSAAAIGRLVQALGKDPDAAVVGVDGEGREQPLQLALRPAAADRLVHLAGPDAGRNASVRRLVLGLGADLRRCPLPSETTFDIDTVDHLRTYQAWIHD